MITVRTESKTVLVVADNCLVTLIPAKLKNAILNTVPKLEIGLIKLIN